MTDLWNTAGKRGVGAGHVDDRGYGVGAATRIEVEKRRRAVRAVAAGAVDAVDCARLLDMLGLDAQESVASSAERAS